jgi:DNA-binding GntR family transcriptional regulator
MPSLEQETPRGAAPTLGDPEAALTQLPARDSTTLVRTVRDRLRQAVVREELPAGMRLSQEQLARQLGVSRMPVRAAITELITEGLLEPRATGGVVVRPLSQKDLEDVYEVRQAIESQAVRHVSLHPSPDGLDHLQQVLREHRDAYTSYTAAQLLEADRAFHMAVLTSTGNEQFMKAVVPLWSVVERAMFRMLTMPGVADLAWDEHEKIAAAIAKGDADMAEHHLREHLKNAAANLGDVISRSQ